VVTTQYGRELRTNRLLENRAAKLYTINAADGVVLVQSQAVLRVRDVDGPVHTDTTAPVNGDEQRLGPFYNYARIATWSYLAKKIVISYQTVQNTQRPGIELVTVRDAALNSIQQWKRFGWMDVGSEGSGCFSRARKAFLCAFLLQSLTGWSAFMIAYNTPVVGMGCRGFAFLIYNTFSLLACVMLISASYLSDWRAFRTEKVTSHNWCTRLLDFIEKTFRMLGKSVAILNTAVIITSCFLQFTGVYQNCYCGSDMISRGAAAIIYFPSALLQAEIAAVSWKVGFAMTIVPCLLFILYFQITKNDIPPNSK
jgi:hypothetical protein